MASTLTNAPSELELPEDEGGRQTLRRTSEFNRNADGSRQTPVSAWVSRLFLLLVIALFLLPLYWMVISSVKSSEEMADFPPTFWPREWHWGNYSAAVSKMPFWTFFRNSAIITVLATAFSVVSNFIVAYGFSCVDWPGRDKVFYVVLATLFLPSAVTLIPMFDLWANLGLVNTFAPLVVPALFASGFFTFLLRQFMLQIPKDMLDAARVDGASEWKIAWTMVFPTARPALTAVGIFAAVASWNDFMGPLIYLQNTKVQTLSIGLQAFRNTNSQDISFNLLMAASVLVLIPLIVVFFAFQKYFVRGITLGGFK